MDRHIALLTECALRNVTVLQTFDSSGVRSMQQKMMEFYKQLDLAPGKEALINRVKNLAHDKFAARAARYDLEAAFPAEDFDDLFHEGLHAAAVPVEYGGLGLGPYKDDVFTLWMMTKELAKADLSLARCWEGHANSLVLIDGMAAKEQKSRWFGDVVRNGLK